jgi:hypothetical protein
MTPSARDAARDSAQTSASSIQNHPAVRIAARVGFAVNGLLHILIGGIALTVASGGGGEADQGGALAALAEAPAGAVLLWVVVVGLWGLALFQVLEAVIIRGSDKDAWADRAKEGGKGVAYLAVGATAFTYATGGSSDSSAQSQSLTAQLLASPGGVVLIVILALAVIAIGGYFLVKGARTKFLDDITLPPEPAGRATRIMGIVGYCAKGVAIAVVGILFLVAAITADPSEATGLDGALGALAALPFGVVVLTVVALGLIAYGVYCFARARYARL